MSVGAQGTDFICFPNPGDAGQRAELDSSLPFSYYDNFFPCTLVHNNPRDDAFMRRRSACKTTFRRRSVAQLQQRPREDRIERNLIFSNDLITISSSNGWTGLSWCGTVYGCILRSGHHKRLHLFPIRSPYNGEQRGNGEDRLRSFIILSFALFCIGSPVPHPHAT